MAVTRASEHANTTPLTEYCSADDIAVYCAGVGADDEGDFLEAFEHMTQGRVQKKLDKLLARAKERIDRRIGHDFEYHEDVDIVVDGNGQSELLLAALGFIPLEDLSAITVDEYAGSADDYKVYEDGRIARETTTTLETETIPVWGTAFPRGKQNIELTITWGYSSVPGEIEQAAAYLTGHYIMNEVAALRDQSVPGTSGGYESISYGDLKISQGQMNPYVKLAKWYKSQAYEIINSYFIPLVTAPDTRKFVNMRG